MIVRDLHLAQNLEELNKKASIQKATLQNYDAKKLISSAAKLLDHAEKAGREKDEEYEYIYSMKYIETVTAVLQKKNQEDQEHAKKMIGMKNLGKTIRRCEELSSTLNARYEQKYPVQKSLENKKVSNEVSASVSEDSFKGYAATNGINATKTYGVSSKNASKVVPKDDCTEIVVPDLKNMIEQKSTSILVIDCRGKSDFFSARINHPNCISIPDEVITEGLSANKMTQILKDQYPDASIQWSKRTTYDKIILYDWSSTFANLNKPIKALYEAMTMWDTNEVYKSKPVILQGGIRSVYNMYPLLLTQPQNLHQKSDGETCEPVKTVKPISNISYPSWEEVNEDFSTLDLSASKKQNREEFSTPKSDKTVLEISMENFNRAPSAAKVPIGIDRSTKPNLKGASFGSNGDISVNRPKGSPKVNGVGIDHVEVLNVPLDANNVNNNESSRSSSPELTSEFMKMTITNGSVVSSNLSNGIAPPSFKKASSVVTNSQTYINGDSLHGDKINGLIEEDSNSAPTLSELPKNENSATVITQRPQIPDASTKPSKYRGGTDIPASPTHSSEISGITTVKLKDEGYDSPRSGMLKRSSSNPNISQISGDSLFEESKSIKPTCDRNLKPSPNKAPVSDYARRRDFQVVSSTERSETGLKNLGNTCYMNSIMQCLNHTISLVHYFVSQTFRKDLKHRASGVKIAEDFARAITEMNQGHRSISLADLKVCFGQANKAFRNYDQQDSHEFLTFLLDHLHEELNRVSKQPFKEQKNDGIVDKVAAEAAWNDYKASNNSIITDLFCGQIKSCVKCLACGKSSTTFDTFLYLSIPIPDNHSQGRRYNIYDCLELFTAEEEMNDWACANCKTSGRAKKKIDLWRMPPTLIIHFQRFYNDTYCKKRMTGIDFPVDHLDLNRYVKSQTMCPRHFQLYGVSNHYGSMDSGHYTAYCRHNKSWSNFDDHVVCQVLPQNVTSAAAYILFYTFVDTP